MAQQQQAAHGEREESIVLPDLVTSTTYQVSKEVERKKREGQEEKDVKVPSTILSYEDSKSSGVKVHLTYT